MISKNYKLKTGKFGTYFELMGVALSNQEVLERLKSLMAIEKSIMSRANKEVVKAAKKKGVKKSVRGPRSAEKRVPSYRVKQKPSAILAEIVGDKPLLRTQVVSKIWDYIKKHNLQNPKNKRNIICDEKLLKIFLKKEVSMFEMAGLVNRNLTPVK